MKNKKMKENRVPDGTSGADDFFSVVHFTHDARCTARTRARLAIIGASGASVSDEPSSTSLAMIAFRVMVADATPRFYVAGGRVSIAGARDAGRRRTPVDFHSTESRGTPLAELTDVALRSVKIK